MSKEIVCKFCSGAHYQTFCRRKPTPPIKVNKRPKQVSDRQLGYNLWREEVARPAVIERDGDVCNCCGQVHYPHDLDEIKGRGAHPSLKWDIDNMQILGRFPCHRNKTDGKECLHD